MIDRRAHGQKSQTKEPIRKIANARLEKAVDFITRASDDFDTWLSIDAIVDD